MDRLLAPVASAAAVAFAVAVVALAVALVLVGGAPAGAQDAGITFEYVGNTKASKAEIDRALEAEKVVYRGLLGVPHAATSLDDAAFLIERLYRQKGYQEASVRFEIVQADGRRVRFTIEEGRLFKMAGPIEFDPPVAEIDRLVPGFRDAWLRDNDFALPRLVTQYPTFSRNSVLNRIDEAKDYLLEQGWNDAKVIPKFQEVEGGEPRMRVRVRVVLGTRSFLTGVTFAGETLYPDEELLRALDLSPWPADDPPYEEDQLLKWKVQLINLYRSRGYKVVGVEYEVEVAPATGANRKEARALFRVAPGDLFRIGTVTVAGNESTDEDVIREVFEHRISEGDVYSKDGIEDARSALIQLDIFSTVSVTEHDRKKGATVDLTIEVVEKPTKSFGFNLGFGAFERVRAGIDFEWSNIAGSGRGLAFRGNVSDRLRRAEIKFVDPLPFGDVANHLRAGPFVERSERPAFTIHRIGFEADFTRQIDDALRLDVGWTFEFSDIRHLGDGLELAGERDEFFSGPRVRLDWDLTDDLILPTRGWHLGVAIETSSRLFGGTSDLIAVRTRTAYHYPVTTFRGYPVVLYGNLRVGFVQAIGSPKVPIQKRLFSGGENSVRSFEEDRLGPENFLDTPIGGELSVTVNLETRFNIWRDFWGVVFADFGTVEARVEQFPHAEVDMGVGAGVRLITPVGPIRLEAAFNPLRESGHGEDLFEVVFTFGLRF